MENKIFNTNSGIEMIDDEEYRELVKQRDKCIQIGDIQSLEQAHSKRSQGGFATGFVLGISAGLAFVLCVVVLYLLDIIKL